jgi:hypothetical protein
MEIINGRIVDLDESDLTIRAAYENINRAILRQYDIVQIGLPDGRTISPEQRKKAHALINEISDWMGELPEYVKRLMKIEFITKRLQALHKTLFSLSDCDVTTAKEFITYLIDFIIEHGVPTKTPLRELCEDVSRYVYACLMHRKCAVCGRKGDMHHEDRVGMGRDRTEIIHLGMRVQPLCPEHHDEAHMIGQATFNEKYHVHGIVADEAICKKWKIKYKKQEEKKC